jgi:hypothetical protein
MAASIFYTSFNIDTEDCNYKIGASYLFGVYLGILGIVGTDLSCSGGMKIYLTWLVIEIECSDWFIDKTLDYGRLDGVLSTIISGLVFDFNTS